MLDNLSNKFSNIFSKLRGYGRLTEQNIQEALRDVRMALLEADVHVGVVRSFLENVKQRALGQEVLESLTPQQQFLKIVHEELITLLGGDSKPFQLTGQIPHVVLFVGLQGCGKTTTVAKVASYLKQKGRHPYLVPADVYRPAAIQQLMTLAEQIGVPYYATKPDSDPVKVAHKAVDEAQDHLCDVVLVDTAGRLHIDDKLMNELQRMQKKLKAPQVLFVADAMTGQEAVKVTKAFHDLLKIDGVILTKLDGDARGGAVLSIQHVSQCPVYFVGVGEKVADLEPFYPDRLVSRLLDRGDILSLIEKAKEVVDLSSVEEFGKKIKKNGFDFEDFRIQLKQFKKIGSLKNLMGLLPGAKAISQKVDMDHAELELKKKEAIINSMTFKERRFPQILNGNRRMRIAQGSGTQVSDVNRLIKEFAQMQKMIKNFSKGGMGSLKGLLGM